jgi:hypothetical protein
LVLFLLRGRKGNEATRQQGNEAIRQRGNEAIRQQGNEMKVKPVESHQPVILKSTYTKAITATREQRTEN